MTIGISWGIKKKLSEKLGISQEKWGKAISENISIKFLAWFHNLIWSDKYIKFVFLELVNNKSGKNSRNTGKFGEFLERENVGTLITPSFQSQKGDGW